MIHSDLQSLMIDGVAAKLGLQLEKLGTGLAQARMEQDLLPITINLDEQTVELESGEEGGPIELVMTVKNYDKNEATQWLRKEFGSKKRTLKKSAPMEILESSIVKMKPVQDFIDNVGYYTIGLFVEREGITMEFPYVITSERELFPCTTEELQQRSLYTDKLPFPQQRWPQESLLAFQNGEQAPSLQDCYEYLLSAFEQHVDVGQKERLSLLALWTLGTYCYRLFGSYPYLHLNGGAGVGKTKALSLIAQLSFNGKHISSGSSPASIIRTIDLNGSTICLDEAEGFSKMKDEESLRVLTLLNTGYKRGGGDEKCEQDPRTKQWRTVFFDAYSPKALAGIRSLDPTLVTRCIPIVMVRSQSREIKNKEITENNSDFSAIRSMIYPAMLQSFDGITEAAKRISHANLSGRDWELWKPILTLAMLTDPTGKLLQQMKILATETQNEKKDMDTAVPHLLSTLALLLEEDKEEEKFYPTEDLYERLAQHDEDTFGWLMDPFKKNARSKWIGHELRKTDVVKGRAQLRSINGEKCRGYILNAKRIHTLLSGYDGYTVTGNEISASVTETSAVTVGVTMLT